MSATESAYANDRVMAVDPFNTEKGILEEAMVTVVLPYIKTAKEGVIRLGKIVVPLKQTGSYLLTATKHGTWKLDQVTTGLLKEFQMIHMQ